MSDAAAWAGTLMSALRAAGLRDVVVSPGSRSTPLVFAAAEQSGFRMHSVVDERAAGFMALGQARWTGWPSILICTSGTAGAHYYPAVIEASMAGVPMVILTADRPPELQSSSAPQTIDQHRMYGSFARAYHDLGLPNQQPAALVAVRRRAAQAVAEAMGPIPGPVHVNVPARKPLEPDAIGGDKVPAVVDGPRVIQPSHRIDRGQLSGLAGRLMAAERPLFVFGPAPVAQSKLREDVDALAQRVGAAVYAEATSQLRFGLKMPGDALGILLSSAAFGARFAPDLVVQFGAPPTSGHWHRWRAQAAGLAHVAIAERTWPDPSQRADTWVVAAPGDVVTALLDEVPIGKSTPWRDWVADADQRAWAAIAQVNAPNTEGAAVQTVRSATPPESILVVGNSLPVRHVDTFCSSGGTPLAVVSQRGANGIDGWIAGAVGARTVADRPVTLLLGDVSFMHDVGALALARTVSEPMVIVVLDNGGGRIFDLLPAGRQFGQEAVFGYFTTPTELHAADLAAAFGLRSVRAGEVDGLRAALREAYQHRGATVIQVDLAPEGARAQLDAVEAAVHRAVQTAAGKSAAERSPAERAPAGRRASEPSASGRPASGRPASERPASGELSGGGES